MDNKVLAEAICRRLPRVIKDLAQKYGVYGAVQTRVFSRATVRSGVKESWLTCNWPLTEVLLIGHEFVDYFAAEGSDPACRENYDGVAGEKMAQMLAFSDEKPHAATEEYPAMYGENDFASGRAIYVTSGLFVMVALAQNKQYLSDEIIEAAITSVEGETGVCLTRYDPEK